MRKYKKTIRYFHGAMEIFNVKNYLVEEVEARFKNGRDIGSKNLSGPRQEAGSLKQPDFTKGEAYTEEHLRLFPVTRKITFIEDGKTPHTCDWRCEGALKHTECKCVCGGKNHGIKSDPMVCN